jgi:drug/metabolite transporter (DMT)-like permease
MRTSRRLAEIHTAVLLFGLAGLFGKWLTLSPLIIVLGRVALASLALGFILLMSKTKIRAVRSSHYFVFLILGLVLAVHWACFFKSIQVSSVAIGLLSYSTFPVFTAVLEPVVFREKLDRATVMFALITLFGVYLIVPEFSLKNASFQGILWGVLAGLTFAGLTVINRKMTRSYASPVIAFYQDLSAAVLLLPAFFVLKPAIGLREVGLLAVLGIFCTAVAHTLFIDAMRRIRAQTASLISSLEPVYGIILAALFLREIPTLRTILGGLVILGAVMTVSLRTLKSA